LEEQSQNRQLPRKLQLRILVSTAAVLAVLLLLAPMVRDGLSAKPQNDIPHLVPGGFRPNEDQWKNIAMGTVNSRKFSGLTSADATVAANGDTATQVFSPFTGQVASIAVRAGDKVRKGDLLMTVAASEAMQSESDLVAASGTLRSAQVTARNADDNEKRQHALYKDGSMALKDWQQSQADQAAAQAALHAAGAALGAARGKLGALGFSDRQIHVLETARGTQTISPLAQIVAPVSGSVVQRLVGVGQFLQANSANPVFAIGNFDRLWLVGSVREEDAPQVELGQDVEVTVSALPGRTFRARLSWIAPAIDPDTHRLAVRAEVANLDGLLKPEMFATMLVHVGGDRVSAAIPEIAAIHEGNRTHVWVSSFGDSLILRTIKPGRQQDGFLEVLSGLAPGDRVALGGSIFLDSTARAE
jgi:cobalt-zinc-cadmium efflux system membrane fusion protein